MISCITSSIKKLSKLICRWVRQSSHRPPTLSSTSAHFFRRNKKSSSSEASSSRPGATWPVRIERKQGLHWICLQCMTIRGHETWTLRWSTQISSWVTGMRRKQSDWTIARGPQRETLEGSASKTLGLVVCPVVVWALLPQVNWENTIAVHRHRLRSSIYLHNLCQYQLACQSSKNTWGTSHCSTATSHLSKNSSPRWWLRTTTTVSSQQTNSSHQGVVLLSTKKWSKSKSREDSPSTSKMETK